MHVQDVSHTACHLRSLLWRFLFKDKGQNFYSSAYMKPDQQLFTIPEVAADWHELMVLQYIMRPHIACTCWSDWNLVWKLVWNQQEMNTAIRIKAFHGVKNQQAIDRCQCAINNAATPWNMPYRFQALSSCFLNFNLKHCETLHNGQLDPQCSSAAITRVGNYWQKTSLNLYFYLHSTGLVLHFYQALTPFDCSYPCVLYNRCTGVFSMILFNHTGKSTEKLQMVVSSSYRIFLEKFRQY